MTGKYIYMVNKKDHAVLILNSRFYVTAFEKLGFEECSHAEYFKWRWGTWNKTKFADIEKRNHETKKSTRSN